MTQKQIVEHWKKGAIDSLEVAVMCVEANKYEHALFNSHLAVEKALKSLYILEKDEAPPYTHDLCDIVQQLSVNLPDDKLDNLREMSRLSVRARYADHKWSAEQATESNAKYWVDQASYLINLLLV